MRRPGLDLCGPALGWAGWAGPGLPPYRPPGPLLTSRRSGRCTGEPGPLAAAALSSVIDSHLSIAHGVTDWIFITLFDLKEATN